MLDDIEQDTQATESAQNDIRDEPGSPGPGTAAKAPALGKGTKSEAILRLLRRKSGVTLAALQEATGWQPHSVRAALSGLRKRGHVIERSAPKKPGTAPRYRIISSGSGAQ